MVPGNVYLNKSIKEYPDLEHYIRHSRGRGFSRKLRVTNSIRVDPAHHMVYFEWPLYQGAILWSSVLFNWFTGHGPEFKSYKYQSEPVSIHDLYDNVATKNFDGWGRHYPIELLPTGTFSSENVNVSTPDYPQFTHLTPL